MSLTAESSGGIDVSNFEGRQGAKLLFGEIKSRLYHSIEGSVERVRESTQEVKKD
jgi:hypothetical protein